MKTRQETENMGEDEGHSVLGKKRTVQDLNVMCLHPST